MASNQVKGRSSTLYPTQSSIDQLDQLDDSRKRTLENLRDRGCDVHPIKLGTLLSIPDHPEDDDDASWYDFEIPSDPDDDDLLNENYFPANIATVLGSSTIMTKPQNVTKASYKHKRYLKHPATVTSLWEIDTFLPVGSRPEKSILKSPTKEFIIFFDELEEFALPCDPKRSPVRVQFSTELSGVYYYPFHSMRKSSPIFSLFMKKKKVPKGI